MEPKPIYRTANGLPIIADDGQRITAERDQAIDLAVKLRQRVASLEGEQQRLSARLAKLEQRKAAKPAAASKR